jgi:hypothetical protein
MDYTIRKRSQTFEDEDNTNNVQNSIPYSAENSVFITKTNLLVLLEK